MRRGNAEVEKGFCCTDRVAAASRTGCCGGGCERVARAGTEQSRRGMPPARLLTRPLTLYGFQEEREGEQRERGRERMESGWCIIDPSVCGLGKKRRLRLGSRKRGIDGRPGRTTALRETETSEPTPSRRIMYAFATYRGQRIVQTKHPVLLTFFETKIAEKYRYETITAPAAIGCLT